MKKKHKLKIFRDTKYNAEEPFMLNIKNIQRLRNLSMEKNIGTLPLNDINNNH